MTDQTTARHGSFFAIANNHTPVIVHSVESGSAQSADVVLVQGDVVVTVEFEPKKSADLPRKAG